MKKTVAFILVVLMLCLLMCSCNQKADDNSKNDETKMRSFTDSLGRTVEVPENIKKVAVSGPLSQIVFYSFAPELLVGVSDNWDDDVKEYIPKEYLELPVLGQLYGGKGELNLEELLASGAEIVVDIGEAKESAKDDLDALQKQTGIPFVHISASIKDMGNTYRILGELCALSERAEEYASYCERTYERTENIMESVGEDNKARVLYCLGENGCNVVAKGAYHAEVIDMLCENLAVLEEVSSKGSGNECDFEQIMNWDPDVIIFALDSIYEEALGDKQWQSLKAVKNEKVYEVPYGSYNWMGFPPSVQRYLGMMWLCKVLYPEYADYELESEVTDYFEMFYHINITHEQYAKLIGE